MKLKTRGKFLLLIILAILLFSIVVDAAIYFQFNNYITNSTLKTYSKLTLQLIDEENSGDWKSENGKLYKGDKLINNDFEIVDLIKKNTDVECTIFLKDTRVSTTIIKDGDRANGTKADDEVVKKVLNEGKEYKGSVNILGTPYKTIYLPIKSEDGSTIGMFFIGIQQQMINNAIKTFIFPIIICTIILLVTITIFIVFLTMNLIISPLETLKMQDEIFANISHELKTPLNVIFSTNQLMELYLKNDSLEDNREKVSRGISSTKQNCYRLIKLINNIVDLSKMESGFFKLDLCNENIVMIVEDIVQSVAEHIKGNGISIVFDTNTEEKIIACDPEKIERILLNLISNAIKFTNPDGGIFINIIDKDNSVEIEVKDTGIGIEKKHLDNIFERFHQVDKSLSRNAEGSGIGLSLVKSIVELHGGNISVYSTLGEGTIFKIVLPARLVKGERVIERIKTRNNKIEMINIEFSDIYSI
jgi:signal transduction histidine kinase